MTKVTTSKCQGGIPSPAAAGIARYSGSYRLSCGYGRWKPGWYRDEVGDRARSREDART